MRKIATCVLIPVLLSVLACANMIAPQHTLEQSLERGDAVIRLDDMKERGVPCIGRFSGGAGTELGICLYEGSPKTIDDDGVANVVIYTYADDIDLAEASTWQFTLSKDGEVIDQWIPDEDVPEVSNGEFFDVTVRVMPFDDWDPGVYEFQFVRRFNTDDWGAFTITVTH